MRRTAQNPAVPVTRVAQAIPPDTILHRAPTQVFETARGTNCVIVVSINGIRFRVTLDTGAARDVIRKSFAKRLREDKRTKHLIYGPRSMSQSVTFVGVIKGMTSSEVNEVTQVKFRVHDSETGFCSDCEVRLLETARM